MTTYCPCKLISFINQENEEITKITHYNTFIQNNLADELLFVVLLLRLNYKFVFIPLKHTFELKY